MTAAPDPREPRPRRVPVGALILVGSVVASFIWWSLMPREAPEPAAADAPGVAAPGPVDDPKATPDAPVAREDRPARPEPSAPPATSAPAPVEAAREAGPTLRVRGDVAGADVFVDRTFVGKTPFESRSITPGAHQINVSAPGYDGVSERVEVGAAGTTEMTFSLKTVKLDAGVDVVHKHALGSCEGRLSATPEGMRYTPTEGRDGFVTALAALEQFAIDYQEKQLRVKIKGGRTFNFTTRAPTADPLFVFHRDVDKARTRLAEGS